ncbi:MAG: hypothetical protein KGJ13_02060 [Patescibacteria group bacterium]|nr:hypothetical protein [Patescibacteria group bacterium]
MQYKYKSVDISTLAGLKKAEWYKAHGWEIVPSGSGWDRVLFQKAVN